MKETVKEVFMAINTRFEVVINIVILMLELESYFKGCLEVRRKGSFLKLGESGETIEIALEVTAFALFDAANAKGHGFVGNFKITIFLRHQLRHDCLFFLAGFRGFLCDS
jgi:hypothetical protein